jgi:hypothetical protein
MLCFVPQVMRRRVYVVNPCGNSAGGVPEFLCCDGACSENGFCGPECTSLGAEEEEVFVPTPPVLELVGPSSIAVEMGTPYTMCPEGASLSAICDRGATAEDETDGVVTGRILACTTDGKNNRVATRGVQGYAPAVQRIAT